MRRPGQRAMRTLPTLEPRRDALEKCVFCPKLSRSACPVSNAEPRETITPWGKMSLGWMAAHGDVSLDRSHAAPAWACTGCFACRESCDHRNDVAGTLLDARAAFAREGIAPDGAARVIDGFDAHDRATRQAARALRDHPGLRGDAPDALLVGCAYLRRTPVEARHALDAASALSGGAVALVDGCCGLPLRLAGDVPGFVRRARALAQATAGNERLLVVDSGCALALKLRYAEVGVRLAPEVELLVERAARSLGSLRPQRVDGDVRWHDPCQLGRGLGVYDAPRSVLARVLGRRPAEFADCRERAECSGAGGLLPSTMPDNARTIADARVEAHLRAGGGRIVTGCASSLVALRKSGARAGVAVDDLVTLLAQSLAAPPTS